MKYFNKIMICFLIAAIVTSFAGCNNEPAVSSDDSSSHIKRPVSSESKDDSTETDEKMLSNPVKWQGPDGYVIIYPDGNKSNYKSALLLQSFYQKSEISVEIKSDSSAETDKEIIIGSCKRKEAYKGLGEEKYAVKVENGKLVFGGGHDITVNKAVYWYANQKQPDGKVYTFEADSDFKSKKLEKYEYVWGDEFETETLDMTKWMFGNDMTERTEMAVKNDDPDIIRVQDSKLKLRAVHYFDMDDSNIEYATSQTVSTQNTMNYLYGYVEMRAKIPFGRGAWPSFWCKSRGTLASWGDDYFTEIDIFENFASANKLVPNIHKWYTDGTHTQYSGKNKRVYEFDINSNFENEYHIIGFEWTPDIMNMYVDNELYMVFNLNDNFDKQSNMNGFKQSPLYLIINNHLFVESFTNFKPYEGADVTPEDLPYEYFIDYVRLYQAPGQGKLYTAKQ